MKTGNYGPISLFMQFLLFIYCTSAAAGNPLTLSHNQTDLPKVKLIKQWAEEGVNIGDSGFYTADLDGDGIKEVIYGSSSNSGSLNTKISILREARRNESGSPDKYEITEQLQLPENKEFFSINGFYDEVTDNHYLVVVSALSEVHVFNLTAQLYLTKIDNVTAEYIDFSDINNDKQTDLLLISEQALISVDVSTWQVRKNYEFPAEKLIDNNFMAFQFGHFLDKNYIDIAFTSGNVYRDKEGEAEQVWTIEKSASYNVAHDVNNDGLDELVGRKCTLDVLNRVYILPEGKSDIDSICDDKRYKLTSLIDPATGSLIQFHKEQDLVEPRSGTVIGTNTITWQEKAYAGPKYIQQGSAHSTRYSLSNYAVDDIDNDGLFEVIAISNEYNLTRDETMMITGTSWLGATWLLHRNFYGSDSKASKSYALGILEDTGDVELLESSFQKYYIQSLQYSHWVDYADPILSRFNTESLITTWIPNSTKYDYLEIADTTGNGDNNLICSYSYGKQISKSMSICFKEVNSWTGVHSWSDVGFNIDDIHIVDIDGDAINDIVVLSQDAYSSQDYRISIKQAGSQIKYQTEIKGSDVVGTLNTLHALDFNNDGMKEVVLSDHDNLFIYWLEESRIEKFTFVGFGNYSSTILNAQTKLLSTNAKGELVSFNQNIEPSKITQICDSFATHLSVNDNNQLYYICDNQLGVFDLETNTLLHEQLLVDSPNRVQILHTDTLSYLLTFTGNKRALYKVDLNGSEIMSLDDLKLTTKSATVVEGELISTGNVELHGVYVHSAPQFGKVNFTNRSKGMFTYTPLTGFAGVDEFTVATINHQGKSVQANVSITVTNNPPTIASKNFSTHWNKEIIGQLSAEDIDNDTLEFSIISQPSTGTVRFIDAASGQFEYKPELTELGAVTFTVKVNDGIDDSQPATITIAHTNTLPSIQAFKKTVLYNDIVTEQLLASDVDNDVLTFQLVEGANIGNIQLNSATGVLTYVPSDAGDYQENIGVRVYDGLDYSEEVIIQIIVQGKVQLPEDKKSSGGTMSIFIWLLFIRWVYDLRVKGYKA
ncbi:hypothetical protein KO495_13015 [Colwellia sp. D2M02]|uniref:Ig-like domain-containing protein n=1 Tax=Colwellia sp. D2M02 TaxID=2841562 RepID=UPI001C0890C0|nr:Ig-like domain-containing protein [Colwellia sp. D2M02]MBU2894234.1 hypothetical protein [Colwellia sp. D2M02]